MTTKLTKAKAVAGVLLGGSALCALIFAVNHFQHNSAPLPSPEGVLSNTDRIAYLQSFGWEVSDSAKETLDLMLPADPSDAFTSYNTIQLDQEMDLTPYCGKRLMRYTYAVFNYPGRESGVQADLYLDGGTVVAGDILAPGDDGFLAGLRYPG